MIFDYLERTKSLLRRCYALGRGYYSVALRRQEAVRFNARLKKLASQRTDILPSIREERTVAFNLVRPYGYQLWIELALAYLLAEAGAHTHLFYDDGLLSQFDDQQAHNLSSAHDGTEALTRIRRSAENGLLEHIRFNLAIQNRFRAFQHDRLTIHPYSEVVESENLLDDILPESHEHHAKSSAIRFFGTEAIDFDAPEVQTFLDRTHVNNRISSAVGHTIVNEFHPDLFVTSHGIYSTWGCCYDVVSESGIPSMVYAVHGTRPHHLWLFDVIAQDVASSPHWKSFKREPLSEDEEEQVEEYMTRRIEKKTPDNQVHFSNVDESHFPDCINQFLATDSDNSISFGLFPNVPWDGNVDVRNTVFEGIVDWIVETIEQVSKTDHRLLIRYHPSETTHMEGARLLSDIIQDRVDVAEKENVLMIASDENVDTYRLLNHVDVGLVYDGTLASEMTYIGIPVIAGGRGRYSQDDWAFMPSSRTEYQRWLAEPIPVISEFARTKEERWEICKRFVYWVNFESSYNFPLLQYDHPIQFGELGELKPEDIINADVSSVLKRLNEEMEE